MENKSHTVSQTVEGWEKYGKEIPLRSRQVIVGEIQAVSEGRSGVDAWRNISCEIENLLTTLVNEMEKEKKWEYDFQGKRSMALKNYNEGISATIEVVKKMGV